MCEDLSENFKRSFPLHISPGEEGCRSLDTYTTTWRTELKRQRLQRLHPRATTEAMRLLRRMHLTSSSTYLHIDGLLYSRSPSHGQHSLIYFSTKYTHIGIGRRGHPCESFETDVIHYHAERTNEPGLAGLPQVPPSPFRYNSSTRCPSIRGHSAGMPMFVPGSTLQRTLESCGYTVRATRERERKGARSLLIGQFFLWSDLNGQKIMALTSILDGMIFLPPVDDDPRKMSEISGGLRTPPACSQKTSQSLVRQRKPKIRFTSKPNRRRQ